MDPVTHSLTGAALARSGLHRTTPLATGTLVIAANIPDVDVFAYVNGEFDALAFRRGMTHGPIAMLLLPLILTGLVLAYDRWWRRRRRPDAAPVRPLPLLALAVLGTLTHPLLDWMNTYGIRLLMPFSGEWFYGDALFIIDPWIWLMLGGALAFHARTRAGAIGWGVLALATSAAVLLAPQVPTGGKVLWAAGVLAVAGGALIHRRRHVSGAEGEVRVAERGTRDDASPAGAGGERAVRAATIAATLYVALMVLNAQLAGVEVRDAAAAAGIDARDIMVAPAPADPLAATIVVAAPDTYHRGSFDWRRSPRVRWDAPAIPVGPRDATVRPAMQLEPVRQFLVWSRYPFAEVRRDGAEAVVHFRDARYPGMSGSLGGAAVRVPAQDTTAAAR